MTNIPPTPQTAAAGWYPQQDGQQRYWDGQQWTEHLAPRPPGAPPVPLPTPASSVRSRRWYTKKRVLLPVGALVLIGALSQAAGKDAPATSSVGPSATPTANTPAGGKTSASTRATKEAAPPNQEVVTPVAKIGSPVRDGRFEFVVTGVKCGISKVGGEYLSKVAQGQFCAMDLTVKNIGDEAQSIFADNQIAFDSAKHKFSADAEAGVYADDSKLLYQEINPGNAVKGKVYFDVPKGTSLSKIQLHDSAFSGGVEVALT